MIAQALAQQAQDGDLLLVPDGLQELYLPYYEQRENVLSLNQALFEHGGDWSAACAQLHHRIALTLESGYAVIVMQEVLRPRPAEAGQPPTPLERFGLQQAQVDACFAPVIPLLRELALDSDLPAAYRIPAAAELLDEGWDFRQSSWGWQAAQVAEARITKTGWQLVPHIDASLTSPPLGFELAEFRAVEITMAAETAARDAQLFLLDAEGQADEERSIRWTLAPGMQIQRYEIDLGQLRDQGLVTRLRLDPVGVGDGAPIVLQSIRLLK
jgi:hypothetical protein